MKRFLICTVILLMSTFSIFAQTAAAALISGTIKNSSGQRMQGVTVSANGITPVTTNSSGVYTIYVPNGWSGTLTPSSSGYAFNPSNRSYTNVTGDIATQNYTGWKPVISGYVRTAGGIGDQGYWVTGTPGGGLSTDANGFYKFPVNYGWSGIVKVFKENWGFEPNGRNYINVTQDQEQQNFVSIPPPVISGYIRDSNGTGISDVTVYSTNFDNTAYTNTDGYYSITVPYDWSGKIIPSHQFWYFDPCDMPYQNLKADITEQNYQAMPKVKISGLITNSLGTGINNFYFEIQDSNRTYQCSTDVNGFYIWAAMPGWSGTVKPMSMVRSFEPGERIYENLFTDKANQDYISPNIINLSPNQLDLHCWIISNALDQAVDGDEIVLSPGVYEWGAFVPEGNYTIRSIEPNNPAIVERTIVTGESACGNHWTVFQFDSKTKSSAVLEGLTIIGAPNGDSGIVINGGYPVIRNCVIKNNRYYGIRCYGYYDPADTNEIKIENCVIKNNGQLWGDGSGIYVSQNGNIRISNCNISGNIGRGIYLETTRDTIIENSIVSGNTAAGISLKDGTQKASIINCTVIGNSKFDGKAGIEGVGFDLLLINDCIVRNNSTIYQIDLRVEQGIQTISYCDIQGGIDGIYYEGDLNWGPGNIDCDPCFANPGFISDNNTPENTKDDYWVSGDYHLKSQAGRWDPNIYRDVDLAGDGIIDLSDFSIFAANWQQDGQNLRSDFDKDGHTGILDLQKFTENYLKLYVPGGWVKDEVTSLCIDAGDPNSDWKNELWPHGKKINMGAYGGTPQASMSQSAVGNIADFNCDDVVDQQDLGMFAQMWLSEQVPLAEDIDRDGSVDFADFAVLANNWLWE